MNAFLMILSLSSFINASASECDTIIKILIEIGPNSDLLKKAHRRPKSCCKLPGITCVGGKVTEIDWKRKNLQGTIPSNIQKLKKLKVL